MKKTIYNQELDEWNLNSAYYEFEGKLPHRQIIYQEILQKSGLSSQHQQILDVGCGAGHVTSFIQNKTKSQIVGVDFSPAMIRTAKKLYPEIDFICSSTDKLPFEGNTQDALLAASLLHHLKVQGLLEKSVAEFFRVLKPDGIFCAIDRQDTILSNLLEKIFSILRKAFKLLKKNQPGSGSSHEVAISQKDINLIAGQGFLLIQKAPVCSLPYKILAVITNFFLYTWGERSAVLFQKITLPLALFSEKHLNSDWFSTDRCLVFKKGRR